MHRPRHVVQILTIGFLVSASSLFAQTDPGTPDTVRVDSVVAFQSGSGVVPVRLVNDEDISALEITLIERSHQIIIDSFSFAGGRVSTWGFKGATATGDSILNIFGFASGDLLPAGSGMIGRLYISYQSSITPQDIPIDSITFVNTLGVEKSTSLTGSNPAGIQTEVPQRAPQYR